MRRSTSVLVAAFILAATLSTVASGQLISLKTVPVASGDQFLVHPSKNMAMGGVTIALDDPWMDPFVNPARASGLRGVTVFGAPTFYSISNNNGSARTLPFALVYGDEEWFGAASMTLQELRAPDDNFGIQPTWFVPPTPELLSESSATNKYFSGVLGKRLSDSGISVAAAIHLADLNAVDGVEHLYALSESIDQFGSITDLRVGAVNDLGEGREIEGLLLYNRFRMTHDVSYIDFIWDGPEPQMLTRVDRNLDRTDTWGLHLRYRQPLTDTGWTIGGIATANYKTHPKIPNYEIMNIPRDPGHSWAYNLGVGVARELGPARFGIDLIYEPISSSTWADTDVPIEKTGGGIIPAGGKTIENEFDFSNAMMRVGLSRDGKRAGLSLGLQFRSIDYDLQQFDNVESTSRRQTEHWLEWSPTWGLALHFPEFEIRYSGHAIVGTGRPGVAWTGDRAFMMEQAAAADFIIAPSGPLTLQDATVVTHQVSVAIPIR